MNDTNNPTSAQIIARHPVTAGCRQAFGIPGGEVLVLLDALRPEGIDFTLCKHENAAGFTAEGSWHTTGAPGSMHIDLPVGLAAASAPDVAISPPAIHGGGWPANALQDSATRPAYAYRPVILARLGALLPGPGML